MNNQKIIIKITLILIAIIILVCADYRCLKDIQNRTSEEYLAYGYGVATQMIDKGTIDTRIQPVCDKLTALDLCGTFAVTEGDTLCYTIKDENGQNIVKSDKYKVEEIYDNVSQRAVLDCRGLTFEVGKTYTLSLTFDLKEVASITTDVNGVVFAQRYVADYQSFLYIILVIINLLAISFVLAFLKWGWNDKLFLAMSLSVGLLAVILTVPFARDDEFRHFVRVYDLATGQKYHHYGDMPEKVYGVVTKDDQGGAAYVEIPAEIDAMRQLDYNDRYGDGGYFSEINQSLCLPKLCAMLQHAPQEGRVWVSEAGTYGRSLSVYWPQVLMVWIGNLLGVRGIFLYYMAKTGQMIVVSLAYWLAWRLAPGYKHILSVIAWMPVGVLLSASCSCDGLLIAEVVLGIAMVLHAMDKKVSVRTPGGMLYWLFFVILVYWIFRIKIPYAMICLGFLPMLIERKPSKKAIGFMVTIAVVLVGVLLINRETILYRYIGIVMPVEHWNHWMENFRWVTYIILRKGADLMRETFQALRGNGLIPYSGLALLAAILSKRRYGVIKKLYSLFLFFFMLLMIVLYGYSLTPPDYGDIVGVSYRYVLPFVPLFLLALPMGNDATENVLDECYPILLIPVVFASLFSFGMF